MLTNLVGLDKTYEATARLGANSTTDDLTGDIRIREERNEKRDASAIEHALDRFRGGYMQTAPAYSAKKIGGKKLYTLARKGKLDGIELPKKDIRIDELAIRSYAWPDLSFVVSCSSGTYIRSLARDIGEALHCGGYLTSLRRTRIGSFRVEDAIPFEQLDLETIRKNIRQWLATSG